MGLFDWLRPTPTQPADNGELATLAFELEEAQTQIHSMAALMAEDRGWQKLSQGFEGDMTREGLTKISQLARVMHAVNPLIKRAVALRHAYVWGQGVGVTARAVGDVRDDTGKREQDVNSVVQAFLDDPGNRRAVTGAQARQQLETSLGTGGNVFIACFTNPRTGFVRARTLPADEVVEIIANPEDVSEPWFFKRTYTVTRIGERTDRTITRQETVYYPALGHRPKRRQPMIDGHPVHWDAPVYHVHVNAPEGKLWGIPDLYPALPWAKAYKEFLEDWAVLMKSLSRIAWRTSSKRDAAQQARQALANMPAQAGAAVHMGPQDTLEAVPKTGATIDSESGRPLAVMIAAAVGLPVTQLLADPGQTGARAVAETLNLPTRIEMDGRRDVWTEAYRHIIGYAIDQAALAPYGPLTGTLSIDPITGGREIELTDTPDRTLDITWPSLEETPIDTLVQAITTADATGKMPPLETLRLLLRALKVRDVDEIIATVTDDNGEWVDPNITAADAAVRAFNQGLDPAATIRGKD